jgi:hypothetical protein
MSLGEPVQGGLQAGVKELLRIPTHSGQAYRFDAGHRSEMKPATVPI